MGRHETLQRKVNFEEYIGRWIAPCDSGMEESVRKSKRLYSKANLQTPPDILYKYMPEARIDVIGNEKIRFTQPHYLNDPFEVKPAFGNIFSDNGFDAAIDEALKETLKETLTEEEAKNPELLRDAGVQAIIRYMVEDNVPKVRDDFVELMSGLSSKFAGMFYKIQDHIAIMSLTEDRNNLLMWSHYADQHRGFVVGFDAFHGFINHKNTEEDDFRHPRRVKYSSMRPKVVERSMQGNAEKLFDMFFLTKSAEWGYEKEWRVIETVSDAAMVIEAHNEKICLYNAPHDAIREIIIGARASVDLKRQLAAMMKVIPSLNHAKLYRAVTSSEKFGLDFVEVRFLEPVEVVVADLFGSHKEDAAKAAIKKYENSFREKTGISISGNIT